MSQYYWRLPQSPCSCLLLLLLLLSDSSFSAPTEVLPAPAAPAAPAAPSGLPQTNCSSTCEQSDAAPHQTTEAASEPVPRGQDGGPVWTLNGTEALANHTAAPGHRANSSTAEGVRSVEPSVHTPVSPAASPPPPPPTHPVTLNTSITKAPSASPSHRPSEPPPPAEGLTEPTAPPTTLKTPPLYPGPWSSTSSTLATTTGPKGSSGPLLQTSQSAAPTPGVLHPSVPPSAPGVAGSPAASGSQTLQSSSARPAPAPPTPTVALVTRVSMVEAAGVALSRQLVDRASLLAVLLFGLLFFLVTVAVFLTQALESFRRKDYTQVDYLINGMYSDSGV